MGYDINIISRHRLKTENVESLANDLSEALDANIEYGYYQEYEVDIKKRVIRYSDDCRWISFGKITHGPDKDTYRLQDGRYEQKNIYKLLGNTFDKVQFKKVDKRYFESLIYYELNIEQENKGDIQHMDITDEIVSIIMCNEPFRWKGFYYNFVGYKPIYDDWEVLNKYRRLVRKTIKSIGGEYVYFHPDQGKTEFICEQLHLSWEKMEEYILSKRYIEDGCRVTKEKIEDCKSEIIDIPAFMLAEKKKFYDSYDDIFRDDFSDLEE